MTLKQLGMLSSVFTLTLFAAGVSRADVISFQLTGSSATVSDSGITFSGFTVSMSPTGMPTVGSTGSILPLNESTTPVSDTTFTPEAGWLTVDGISLTIDSNEIGSFAGLPTNSCGSPAFVGQTCTPVIPGLANADDPGGYSNFSLINTSADSFFAGFTVDGTAVISGVEYDWLGQFSNAGTGSGTFQNVLATLPRAFSYIGSITLTSVPEPGFLPLFGGLAILVAFASLYRRVRTQQQ
jgi:hypothetical protein